MNMQETFFSFLADTGAYVERGKKSVVRCFDLMTRHLIYYPETKENRILK
jgi:hypothetical protein